MKELPNNKIINIFFLIATIGVFLSFLTGDILWRVNLIKTSQLTLPYPKPYYDFMIVPGTSPEEKSPGALGADFAQVYFSAKAISYGQSAYNPVNPQYKDPFNRPPNYPPLTNNIYRVLTIFPYHKALLIHNFGTIFVFLSLSVFTLKMFNLVKHAWKVLLLFIFLYFYTPLGYAHFERGQFDLFVASSYLLLFVCVFTKRRELLYGILSGLLGAIKWSSIPFLGTFSLFSFVGTNNPRRWSFLLSLIIIVLSGIIFLPEIQEYWPSLQRYEINAKPTGVNFEYLLPKPIAKSIQIISCLTLIVVFLFFSRQNQRIELFKSISFPFALAMAAQGICFGTISYEYRVVSFLGLIPALLVWLENTRISVHLKLTNAVSFAIFLIIVFRAFSFLFQDRTNFWATYMSIFYLFFSLLLVIECFYIIFKEKEFLTSKG